MAKQEKKLEDDIPSSYAEKFNTISKETWKHEDFRKKVLEICSEHENTQEFVGKVKDVLREFLQNEAFIDKVKALADKQVKDYVDASRVKTILWVVGLIVTAIVGIFAQKFGNLF
jgi:phosphate starvation-inducible protein PhoH